MLTPRLRKRLEEKLPEAQEASKEAGKQWRIWLAAGNGAGLLLLGGALINGWKLNLFFAILPALWAFSIALISVGLKSWVSYAGLTHLADLVECEMAAHDGATVVTGKFRKSKELPQEIEQLTTKVRMYGKIETGLETLSSLLFIFGVIWPLTIATFFPQ